MDLYIIIEKNPYILTGKESPHFLYAWLMMLELVTFFLKLSIFISSDLLVISPIKLTIILEALHTSISESKLLFEKFRAMKFFSLFIYSDFSNKFLDLVFVIKLSLVVKLIFLLLNKQDRETY